MHDSMSRPKRFFDGSWIAAASASMHALLGEDFQVISINDRAFLHLRELDLDSLRPAAPAFSIGSLLVLVYINIYIYI